MHKIILGILLLSSTVFSLEWVKDIDTAFTLAKKEHKTVMVFVEGKNCSWCRKMKGRTLTEDSVKKRLEKFVVVKVMREDSKSMAVLPKIKGVPTIFFMKSNKKVIESVIGYLRVRDFISTIDDVEKMAK